MKKAVRIALHVCFWVLIPLTITFYNWAGQADKFFGLESHSKNFFQILFDGFHSLFIHPDMGSAVVSFSNLTNIVSNLVASVLFPITVFYLFYGYFSPKLMKNRNIMNTIIPILFVFLVPFAIINLLSFFTLVAWSFYYWLSLTFVITLFFAVSGFFFCLLERWFETQKLVKQNLQSELALLKNQISPHFLFNTLNNIDSLIRSNTAKASEVLIKLSGLLRYMIYETSNSKVKLSNEIEQIKSYIELQKIQFANKDLVYISIVGIKENISIAPMLFLPFVENAFKHCTDKNMYNAIKFSFTIHDNQVLFESSNVFDPIENINKDATRGIGLNILKRRLELIYPEKHALTIKTENNKFIACLLINTYDA